MAAGTIASPPRWEQAGRVRELVVRKGIVESEVGCGVLGRWAASVRRRSPPARAMAWAMAVFGVAPWTECANAQSAGASQKAPPEGSAAESVRYILEGLEIRGNVKTRTSVLEAHVPLQRGDVLDVDDPILQAIRYRLLGTGFFRTVQLSLRKGSARGRVLLVIDVVERNTIVITDLAMGLSRDANTSGESRPLAAFMGVAAAERNLAGTGVSLGTALALAQGGAADSAVDQLALRVHFFDPALFGTRWTLSGEFLYNDAVDFFGNSEVVVDDDRPVEPTYAIVEYKRFGGRVSLGRSLSLASRFALSYRLETVNDVQLPRAAAQSYGGRLEPIDFELLPGRSLLSTLRASLEFDTRDHPLMPSRGWMAFSSLEVSLAPAGSDYAYSRIDLRAQRWWQLPFQHVVSADVLIGAIAGDAPLFEKYYAGDLTDFQPGRLLGLNFDPRPAPDFLGTAVKDVRHAEYAFQIGGEYRIPVYRGVRSVFAIDFFAAVGGFVLATRRELVKPSSRFDGLARVPFDLTGNLGFRLDTNLGGFTFAFSNVLGFLPVRREGGE